jgi:uracil-DNA glycosylase
VRVIPSGKELEDNYLAPLQISRSQCWITDLVKVFLFKGGHVERYRRLGNATVTETRSQFRVLAERSLKWLAEEIDTAKPKAIISLGVEVTSVLFGTPEEKSKALLDGAVRPLLLAGRENTVMCLPHPGIIMKRTPSNPWPQRFEQVIRPHALSELKRLGF